MKKLLALTFVFAAVCLAQLPYVPMVGAPQVPVPISVTQVGQAGSTTYCYWIVAIYTGGKSQPSGPLCTNTSNATLSATNYNVVTFAAPSSPLATPTGYDLLRTAGSFSNLAPGVGAGFGTSATSPTGSCACAVSTAQSGSPLNDQANGLNAYTVATLAPSVFAFYVDNVTTSTPTVKLSSGGAPGVATVTALPVNRVFTFGPLAAGAASSSFVVDAAYKITSVSSTIATQASAACTITVERLTGTTAGGSGTAQLTAAFNWQTQVINTVTAGSLIATPSTFSAASDRMGVVVTGACTTLAGGYVTVVATLQQ